MTVRVGCPYCGSRGGEHTPLCPVTLAFEENRLRLALRECVSLLEHALARIAELQIEGVAAGSRLQDEEGG